MLRQLRPLVVDCPAHGAAVPAYRKGLRGLGCTACRSAVVGKSVRKYRHKTKDRLVASFGGKCSRCGYSACPRALHFHHDGGKRFEIADGLSRGMSYQRLSREAAKCSLICANCHAEVHAETSA